MEITLYDNIQQIEATHWWYQARREIIFDWVQRALSAYDHPRILDIGCGTGYNLTSLQQLGCEHITGIDLSPYALAYCRARQPGRLVSGDGSRLPFAAASFDMILALDLVEHIDDDQRALREIFRALKPGGTAVLFVPAYQFLWSFQDEISHHYRRYDAAELRHKVQKAGFEIQKLTYLNTFMFPAIWAGRALLRLFRRHFNIVSENQLHPSWTNGILYRIFRAELPILKYANLPFGVSLLCVCRKA